MAEPRTNYGLLTYVVLVVALAATSIVWWTVVGSRSPGTSPNVMVAGEVAFQFVTIGVPLLLLRRRRHLRRPATSDAETDIV